MPPIDDQDDNELEPGSSDGTALDVAAGKTKDTPAAPAEPSTATGENDEDDLLNVVRDVVEERPAVASPAAGEEVVGDEAGGTPRKEPDDENFSDVPFNKHPRFQQLLSQRREFKVDAVRYRNVQTFLDNAGMTAEEAADGLSIMALAKTDPAAAWKQIKPWVQKVLVAAGEVLPDDLSERVKKGELTQDAAFEISRGRAQVSSATTRQTFEQQQRERRENATLADGLRGAATSWEKDRRLKDPNFEAKFIPLQKEVAFLQLSEGKPKTPDGVLDQLKRAYKAVNEQIKSVAPALRARPALRPVVGGQKAGNIREEPKSTLDIVRANRRKAG